MRNTLSKVGLGLALLSWCLTSFGLDVGGISSNLFSAVVGIRKIIHVLCLLTGTGLIMGAFVRYQTHRKNPVVAPLSAVFALLIAGIVVISLIFIPIGEGNK